MYRFFPASIELRQEPFLWAEDLSTYDSILSLPFAIPIYGDHVSLFCLLSALSSVIYMRINQQMSPSAGGNDALAQQMKMFQYIMPVMLLFIFNSFSAALCYYFLLSNVFSFGQQWVIKKYFIDEDALRLEIAESKKRPKSKNSGGFQARLEKMLKEQQAKQREMQESKSNTKTRRGGNNRKKKR
jgi:YidC/Oxa1 family membrane protein insertase